ncbi:MAG: GIY-YIG nuclease family protein [Ignavibacteriales bacterium]|nr:GIY-YIG nuclease family protein [Ignavibacteriales bacterium]
MLGNQENDYCVYVLRSIRDGRHYIGMTKNLERRLNEHNSGKVKSTKGRTPFELVYHETYRTRSEAHEREKYFKTATGRRWLKETLGG